jgi:hypothetical protein
MMWSPSFAHGAQPNEQDGRTYRVTKGQRTMKQQTSIVCLTALLTGMPAASALAQMLPPECLELPPGTPCPGITVFQPDPDPDGEATFDRSVAGTLVVNAQDGNGVLSDPHDGMTFGSQAEAIAWAQANLNGTVEYDLFGNAVSVQGSLITYGKLFYSDASTQSLTEVDDYIAYALGGTSGIVTIAGTPYCLRDDGCLGAGMTLKAAAPEETPACADSTTRFCIKSSSWKTAFPPILTIYRSIGSEADQTEGGFRITHHFCWKAFIPWSCSRKSGSNIMSLTNRYRIALPAFDDPSSSDSRATPPLGTVGEDDESGEASNVESIKMKQWGLFAGIKSSRSGTLSPLLGDTAAATVTGVCGGEGSRDKNIEVGSLTAAGNHASICE